MDDKQRKRYDEYLRTGKKQESDEADRIVRAELQFQKGLVLLRTQKFQEAINNFQWAVDLRPEEGEYFSYLGWATFRTDPASGETRAKALQYIKKGLELNKKQDTGLYFLGRVLKVSGRTQEALEAFRAAYGINPGNFDALREIRAMDLAKQEKSQKGVFKKIFK